MSKVWKVSNQNQLTSFVTIPSSSEQESKEMNVAPLATLDAKGTMAAVYRGK